MGLTWRSHWARALCRRLARGETWAVRLVDRRVEERTHTDLGNERVLAQRQIGVAEWVLREERWAEPVDLESSRRLELLRVGRSTARTHAWWHGRSTKVLAGRGWGWARLGRHRATWIRRRHRALVRNAVPGRTNATEEGNRKRNDHRNDNDVGNRETTAETLDSLKD